MDEITSIKPAPSPRFEINFPRAKATAVKIQSHIKGVLNITNARIRRFKSFIFRKTHTISPAVPFVWFGVSTVTTLFVVAFIISNITTPAKIPTNKYSIFSSKPLVLGISTEEIFGNDSRAAVIDKVFAAYNCPLTGLGEKFIEEADKNDIPYWLVPAVAFQESGCGKITPKRDGVESYNAWGWGVWGDNVILFDNWEQGIETVSAYMHDRFFSKGVTEPCDIMRVYTPPSSGSWCLGVNYFKDVIIHYKSPFF